MAPVNLSAKSEAAAGEIPNALDQSQRVLVELEDDSAARRVKISVESHDARLGWYTSSTLSVPLHQLPLLEQALRRLGGHVIPSDGSFLAEVIPFPSPPSLAVAE